VVTPAPQAPPDRLWKAKQDAGYSSNSIRIMRTVLRRTIGQAEREGMVNRNVAKLSAAPRIRARPGRTLTVDQARQLLDAAASLKVRIGDQGLSAMSSTS
jgi:integrase